MIIVLFAGPGHDDDIGIDLDLVDETTVLSKLIIVGCVYILYAVGLYRIQPEDLTGNLIWQFGGQS